MFNDTSDMNLEQLNFQIETTTITTSETWLMNLTSEYPINGTKNYTGIHEDIRRDTLGIVVPITIVYALIFFTGLIGNVSTCIVIARNKSMHTATNYYLFSLAISDLLLLLSGLPPEMYYIWSKYPYIFGEAFCIIQSFAAETSANATVLTITAFTIERYVAICHPFLSHTMSKLSRAVKFVIAIWLLALCLAIPQAIQFGIVFQYTNDGILIENSESCTVKQTFIEHAFEISTILFFVVPMTVITVLYILIGLKLRSSRLLSLVKRTPPGYTLGHTDSARGKSNAQKNVIRMLVAVVVAFFICWAPFHAQRLLAVYAESNKKDGQKTAVMLPVYKALTYVSGVLYYLSTTINPLLYNIMSNKFREAFKAMLSKHCGRRLQKARPNRPSYSSFSRYPRSALHRGGGCGGGNHNGDPQISASLSCSDETQRMTNANHHDYTTKASTLQLMRDNSFCSTNTAVPKNYHRADSDDTIAAHQSELLDCSKQINSKRNSKQQSLQQQQTDLNGHNPQSRGSSNSSQTTILASCDKPQKEQLAGSNNNKSQPPRAGTKPQKHRSVNLGILKDRLKLGAGGLLTIQPHALKLRMRVNSSTGKQPVETVAVYTKEPLTIRHSNSQPSIRSANTISNSSLQDLEEIEFNGKELARYMGELNGDLIA